MPPEVADPPGLPAEPVRRWLREHLPELDQTAAWRPRVISGGLSNITYRVELPGGSVIVRRPPMGKLLPRAHDVAREYRVLSALAPTAVPVPVPLALCTDPDVIGVPFYLMSDVHGRILRSPDDTTALSVAARAEVGDQLARALAGLHAVDPDEVGLGDYGRRVGYNARQIHTWGAQWQRSRTTDLPAMDRLLALLAECAPPDSGSAIVHGDYRLDNAIFELGERPRLAAVLDWELSTLGDPLADLGLAMTYWHDLGDTERAAIPVAVGLTALAGFPTTAEFAARYAGLSGRDVPDIGFYLALGAMKLAVILEGVHARYLSGRTVGDGYEAAGAGVPALVRRGLHILGHGAS